MNKNTILIIAVLVVVGVLAYGIMTQQQKAQEPTLSGAVKSVSEKSASLLSKAQEASEQAIQKASSAKQELEAKATSQESDIKAQIMELLAKAKGFIENGKYQEAINTAQFILSNLDKNSLEAKSLIELAQNKLKEVTQEKLGDVTKDLSFQGEGLLGTAGGMLGQ